MLKKCIIFLSSKCYCFSWIISNFISCKNIDSMNFTLNHKLINFQNMGNFVKVGCYKNSTICLSKVNDPLCLLSKGFKRKLLKATKQLFIWNDNTWFTLFSLWHNNKSLPSILWTTCYTYCMHSVQRFNRGEWEKEILISIQIQLSTQLNRECYPESKTNI